MKTMLQIIIATGLSISLVACAGKSDAQKSIDQARNAVDQAKKDTDNVPNEAKKSSDEVMDTTAPGGQPGSISFSGAAVSDEGTLDARVTIKSSAGIGWRGDAPKVNANAVLLRTEIAASTLTDIESLQSDDNYINVGCTDMVISDRIQHLKPSEPSLSSNKSVETLKANTIFICDASQLASSFILVEAHTVIFHSLSLVQKGFLEKIFVLTASDLILEENNSISSIGTDGASTLSPGPSISITAERLIGAGTLNLRAQGSSYQRGQP